MTISLGEIQDSTIFIYGRGSFGRLTLEFCNQLGLEVDGYVDHLLMPNDPFGNVLSVEDLPIEGNITVILGVCNLFGDLQKISSLILSRNRWVNIITPVQFAKLCHSSGIILENYWLTGDIEYLSKYSDKLLDLKHILEDEHSRLLVDQIVKYRVDGFFEDIPKPDDLEDQYLPSGLSTPPNSLNMLELGSFKGEDLKRFVERSKDIKFAFCIEPDFENYRALISQISELGKPNMFPLPIGAWKETSQLKFASNGQTGAKLNDHAEDSILVMSMDDLIGSSYINYIKMDIEGAEISAIEGLKNTIFNQNPHLAISVYHKPSDLWEIPLKINQIAPDAYTFYLRVYGHQTFDTVLYCIPRK